MPAATDERRLEPETLEALGLEAQPFEGAPPVPPDEDDETRVNLALSVLEARATPLLVSGVPGSGRSHFLALVASAADTLNATRVDARAEDPAAALLAAGGRRGPQALLVDNASGLDAASLDALLRQARELDCALALAVDEDGTETLAQRTAQLLELAEPPPVLRLPPFSEPRTRLYVDHRIAQAGGSPSRLLRPADYRRIHRLSGGLPARIDTVAAAVLRGRSRRGPGTLSGRSPTLLLAGGALAIAVLSLAVLNPFGAEEETFEEATNRETVAVDITRDEDEAAGGAEGETIEAGKSAQATGHAAAPSEPQPDIAPPVADVWGLPDPLAALPDDDSDAAAQPAPEEAPAESAPVQARAPAGAEAGDAAATAPAAAEIATADTTTDAAEPATAGDSGAAADAVTASAAVQGATGDTAVQTDEDWLASRPAEHYTIQLLAARQRSTVDRFLAQNPQIEGDVRIVRGERGGEAWYRLFLGDYPDREAARDALAALPEGARSAGAWTPTFGSVR